MGSMAVADKPHAVCIPYPAQGHINPVLKLAKLLHSKGFHITFVNTEYNHKRLLRSRGPAALAGLPDFRFDTIPDGLPPPPPSIDATQDIPSLCVSTSKTCIAPFCDLLSKLNDTATSNVPPVTCIVSDGVMSFTLEAAEKFGVPEVLFWTTSACGFLGYTQYKHLVERGLTPLKDESCHRNGYLNTTIDWLPGMNDDIQLRDMPSFVRTTDPDDIMLNFLIQESGRASKASAIIINTFDELERDALDALSSFLPPLYTVGPLQLMLDHVPDDRLKTISSNLWREEPKCIEWLNSKQPNSVLYVNFGSITVMTQDQLTEFAWGLANSNKDFLWIIRPDLVSGVSAILPAEFVAETRERGCWRVGVLRSKSSNTRRSPEQPTNCRYSCKEWGIGMEIDSDVRREEVEMLVRELMEGEKGREMKSAAVEWKRKADAAAGAGGSSYLSLDNLIREVLLSK
ncbi:UDP-glucosyl transferase 85A2 [Actinidia rufa]|uniref:UDP-glucosyl transferase 85A2 n=1 Tax=Actinidia rufa TaxID=165716 RepID=A0A7J0DH37_9ERIC|nr:UDP-glucosyl transferase 85A2 [Actinidia rufa]